MSVAPHAAILPLSDVPDTARLVLIDATDVLLYGVQAYWPAALVKRRLGASATAIATDVTQDTPVFAMACQPALLDGCGVSRCGPRQLMQSSSPTVSADVGRALQLIHWISTHRFCGVCGQPLLAHPIERALQCPQCQHRVFPRISPCVIVLVQRDRHVLLARHAGRNSATYSCLAGFMEVGETPEQTICREVREETTIDVRNIRYVASQSWPFPSQLMLGFQADYAGGEIAVDGQEILEARWFAADALPDSLPPPFSVAGQLIALFLQSLKV